jgi:hypothetical protein
MRLISVSNVHASFALKVPREAYLPLADTLNLSSFVMRSWRSGPPSSAPFNLTGANGSAGQDQIQGRRGIVPRRAKRPPGVRWKCGPNKHKEPFRHSGQAVSFRSKLVSAAKDGKAFSIETGRPVKWERDKPKAPGPPPVTWYSLTLDYAKAKWKFASPNQRRSIAEALTDATEVLFAAESPYPRTEIRRALATWAYSARLRCEAEPPEDIAPVIKWLETTTITVDALGAPETSGIYARAILDRINSKQDNTRAAPNTANRKRAVLNNLMTYAERERKLITGNPLKSITWTEPRKLKTVDPRCVLNPEQGRRFLNTAGKLGERGKRLKAFYGCMYYAALRPEEVTALRKTNIISLPEQDDE